MGKPSPPPPPDYAAAAKAQGIANQQAAQQTAVLSNPNIISPYGTQTVTYDVAGGYGGTPQPTITQTLTPEAQAALSAQQGVQRSLADLAQQGIGTVQGVMGKPFQYQGPGIQTSLDMSGVPKAPVAPGTTGQQAIMARLQPQLEMRSNALRQNLANQGITPGSEAWNNAMREESQSQNDLLSQAALQGIGLDTAAQQNAYNQALQSAQFGNTAAAQALQQQLGLYNVPLNQITALMSGSQIQAPQFQQYTGGGQIGAAPLAQAAANQGNYNTAAYNAQMQGYGGLLGGLGSIAGAGLVPNGFLRGLI